MLSPIARRGTAHLALAAALAAVLVAGCRGAGPAPSPSPADFGGIGQDLARQGIAVSAPVSGDAGCSDASLVPTAIRFTAAGLDQPTPVTARLYIFGSAASYDRLRQAVDACAASYATDPAGLVELDASPYVLVGQGPWPPRFVAALRAGIAAAAGGH